MALCPRPRRIPMLGGRAHFSHGFADLVNVSRTGVLIRTNYAVRVGSEWPMTLKLSGQSVSVTGRVVRCDQVDVGLPAGASLRNQFGVALMFIAPPPEAETVLMELCGDGMDMGTG